MKSKIIRKTYSLTIGKFVATAAAFALLAFSATFVNAQVTNGTISVDIDQCANGPKTAPVNCTGSNWQNGNLNENQSHWNEGDSVAYRDVITGLPIGETYTLTIQYDTTQNGKHAEDFLTSYDRTEHTPGNDPCSGETDCVLGQGAAIPVDPMVTAGRDGDPLTLGDNIVQIPGFFYASGVDLATMTAGNYQYTGTFAKDAKTSIDITFTTTSSNVVIAWGGHISTRLDWGFDASAVNISGSPYHMRNLSISGPNAPNLGNQDRSLTASAIFYPALVKIIKSVEGLNGTTTSTDTFEFVSTNPAQTFTLTDAVEGTGPSAPEFSGDTDQPDWKVFSYGLGQLPASGMVSEPNPSSSGLSLARIDCVFSKGATANGSFSVATGALVFTTLDQGDGLVCTFVNQRTPTTAATAVVTGKVTTAAGKGIKGATVTAYDNQSTTSVSVKTDAKGNYKFTGLETTHGYRFTATAAGYSFGAKDFYNTPIGDSQVINFTASGAASTKGH